MNSQDDNQNNQDSKNLIMFRLTQLESQIKELSEVCRKTSLDVATLATRISGPHPLPCGIHQERMATIDARVHAVEASIKERDEIIEDLKKFMWKMSGGLVIGTIVLNLIIAPFMTDMFRPKTASTSDENQVHIYTTNSNGTIMGFHKAP